MYGVPRLQFYYPLDYLIDIVVACHSFIQSFIHSIHSILFYSFHVILHLYYYDNDVLKSSGCLTELLRPWTKMTFSLASLSFWDLLLWCFVLAITLGASILLVSTIYLYN